MNNYRVSFYKLKKEEDKQTGKTNITGQEYLGSVTLDDSGVDSKTSLVAIAFRRATPVMQIADKTVTERL